MGRVVYVDDVEVGDSLPPLRLTLSGADVRRYALASNMPGGRFMSNEEARAEGLRGQIAPGNMSVALLSRLLTGWGEGVTLRRLSATFRGFVRPDVPLLLSAVVTEKHIGAHEGFVECDLLLEGEDGDRCVTGTATVAMPSK